MKLNRDPSVTAPERITAESLALAKWYDANPAVQRLWGIRDEETLRVVVALEPTHDSDDVYPAWVAHCQTWANELRRLTGNAVQLQLAGDSPLDGIEFVARTDIVADLYWRDATLIPPHCVT